MPVNIKKTPKNHPLRKNRLIYEIKYINIGSYISANISDFFSEDWIFLFAEIFNLLLLILIFYYNYS